MAQQEVDLIMNRATISSTPAATPDNRQEEAVSATETPRQLDSHLQSTTLTSLPIMPTRKRHEAISIDSALANEAFKSFRFEEKEQFEKVSAFECNQRKALSAHHAYSLKRLAARHGSSKADKLEQVRAHEKFPRHVSLLMSPSISLILNTWKKYRLWPNMTYEKLMIQNPRTSLLL